MSPVHAWVRAIQRDAGAASPAPATAVTSAPASAWLACLMTTSSGMFEMRVRLLGRPSDPQTVTAAITDRSGVVHIWVVGRDLLEAGVAAPASRPARRDRIWVWTTEGPAGRSLMVARASPSFEVLELDWARVGAFLADARAQEAAARRWRTLPE